MVHAKYPDELLLGHRHAHDALVRHVQTRQAQVDRGAMSLGEALRFLYGDRLIAHICTMDHDYVRYLQAVPASEAPTRG